MIKKIGKILLVFMTMMVLGCSQKLSIDLTEVKEPGSGRVWLKCPVGMVATGDACKGEYRELSWDDAMKVCPKGFKVPSMEDYEDLLGDSGKGRLNNCQDSENCRNLFGKDSFTCWSSTRNKQFEDQAMTVSFHFGYVVPELMKQAQVVRCIKISNLPNR